jgi:hypothetical protein
MIDELGLRREQKCYKLKDIQMFVLVQLEVKQGQELVLTV